MTRLNGRLVVQRVNDLLVVMDEQAGAEITFPPQMRERLVETIGHLFPTVEGSYVGTTYWYAVCSEPGCESKSTELSDYAAWGDKSGARDEAVDSDWAETTDGLLFCPKHRNRACSECDKHVPGGASVEHDSMCDDCWAADPYEDRKPKTVPWASSSGHGEMEVPS